MRRFNKWWDLSIEMISIWVFESHLPEPQRKPGELWEDIGSQECKHFHQSDQTASPKDMKDDVSMLLLSKYLLTCLPECSIWKFLADSWVTRPPKSSWYTWLPSFQSGALLCITNCLACLWNFLGDPSGVSPRLVPSNPPRSSSVNSVFSRWLSFRSWNNENVRANSFKIHWEKF